MLSDQRAAGIAASIESWFARNARELPWRKRRTGYATLVAESMLQQTQVSRVVDPFKSFIRRFPNVRALAAADEEAVLSAWKGLGYYRRAINLHRAAIMIGDRYAGRVPRRVEQLMKLPGVGRYTAGAIASLAYDERAAIVDGNITRVALRVLGCDASPDAANTTAMVWRVAETLIRQASRPSVLNEGLMELGALVCTPSSPHCGKCPIARECRARKSGMESNIPLPRRAAKQKIAHHHAIVIRRGGLILLEKRAGNGLWAGMWQTPTIEADHMLTPAKIRMRLPVHVDRLTPAARFLHQTTHRRITFHVFVTRSRAKMGDWRRLDEIRGLPFANPQRRILTEFLH